MKLVKYSAYQIHRETSAKYKFFQLHLWINASPAPPPNRSKLFCGYLMFMLRRTQNLYSGR